MQAAGMEAEAARTLCIRILQVFYLTPYSANGFYEEFERRLNEFHV